MSISARELFDEVSDNNSRSAKEIISRYISHLPLFITSLAVCIVSGIVYLKYITPKYNVSTFILVKTNLSKPTGSANGGEDLVTTVLNGGKDVLLDNELTLIRSSSLMEKVAIKNQFNISCFSLNQFKQNELYPAPFRLVLEDTGHYQPFNITIKDLTTEGAVITYSSDKENQSMSYKWNTIFKINGKKFIVTPADRVHPPANGSYIITWNSPEKTAEDILDNLTVDILDKKTTILQIDLLTENKTRGEDILNALWKEYIAQNMEDKNAISQNTIRFIDDRLNIISQELNGVEGNLEDYQGNNQIINAESQSAQSLNNASETSKDITSLNIQKGVVDMLQNYFNSAEIENNPVPSNLGINDPTLASLILKYNELQIKKQRETPLLAINSPILQDLNNQLSGLKKNILENLQNIRKNLQLQEVNLQQKNQQYNSFLSSLPHKERVIQTIKRKQTITEGLYLYLLQKREEAVISSSTSNVSNYKQIDSAKAAKKAVEPKPRLVYFLSVILGMLIPIIWIQLREKLGDKIDSKTDVIKRIKIPILGELNNISRGKLKEISVTNDKYLGEAFRKIRTNISVSQNRKNKQSILITSSEVGAGKSMVAKNLAMIFALPGKKVALLEFNFKRPDRDETLDNNSKGITDYLNEHTSSLSEISSVSNDIPTLHYYTAGRELSNASDLLLKDTLPQFFKDLKAAYEYIIIDTAATDVASDVLVLEEYSDLVLFVVREGFTSKDQLGSLEELSQTDKLNNIGILYNGLHG